MRILYDFTKFPFLLVITNYHVLVLLSIFISRDSGIGWKGRRVHILRRPYLCSNTSTLECIIVSIQLSCNDTKLSFISLTR